jgi:ATP-dependent DNA helicase RecQ
MSAVMPTTAAEMLDVKGVGENKMEKYGQAFLQEIATFKEKALSSTTSNER